MSLRVLYIASLPHSGSTLLDLLLGSHSALEGLGEIQALKRYVAPGQDSTPQRRRQCTCGASSVWLCPFWSAVDATLRLSGIDGLQALNIASENEETFRRDNSALFRAIAEVAEKRVLVDSSKSLTRLRRLMGIPGLTLLPVFLHRAPTGQIASMVRKYGDAERQIELTLRGSGELLGFFSDRTDPFVSYASLSEDPKAVLTSLLQPLGLEYEKAQLNWTDQPHHNLGGNRMRFFDASEIRRDDSAAASLSPDTYLTVHEAAAGIEARLSEFLERRKAGGPS